jgi:hypothetical protein
MPRLAWRYLALVSSVSSAGAAQPAESPRDIDVSSPGQERPPAAPSTVTRERSELEDAPAERRYGLSAGFAGGLTLGNVHGYPNDVTKIGENEFEVNSGVSVNSGGAFWIGGALSDWLTLGVGAIGGSINGNGLTSSGGSLQFRIETFPLFQQGGAWRDLGIVFTAGTGGYEVERDGETVAEGAGTSVVGGGVFFEPWRLWRFATGPEIEYVHHFSRSLSAHLLVVGWRVAFYAGP